MRRLERQHAATGILSATAFSLIVALSAPGASAANAERDTANQQGATATNPAGSDMIKPDQMRASKMIGSTVYDVQNQKIGDVKDMVLDKDGQAAAASSASAAYEPGFARAHLYPLPILARETIKGCYEERSQRRKARRQGTRYDSSTAARAHALGPYGPGASRFRSGPRTSP